VAHGAQVSVCIGSASATAKALLARQNPARGTNSDESALCVYPQSAKSEICAFVRFVIAKNPKAIFSPNSLNLRLNWASEMLINLALDDLIKSNEISSENGLYFKFGSDLKVLQSEIETAIYNTLQKRAL